jgi:hypothetical protein
VILADIITFDDDEEMYTGRMIEGSVVEDDDEDLPAEPPRKPRRRSQPSG